MSISLNNVSAMYPAATENNQTADKLSGTLNGDLSKASDKELMDVCKDFEAYFTEQMFKAMEKMVPKDEDESGSMTQLKDYFADMRVAEYAKASSEGNGLGIAQMMYEQMKRNYGL